MGMRRRGAAASGIMPTQQFVAAAAPVRKSQGVGMRKGRSSVRNHAHAAIVAAAAPVRKSQGAGMGKGRSSVRDHAHAAIRRRCCARTRSGDAAAAFEGEEDDCDVGGVDAGEARGLTEGGRTKADEHLTGLVTQAGELCVVEVVGDTAALHFP
jgi:hypothetical protein